MALVLGDRKAEYVEHEVEQQSIQTLIDLELLEISTSLCPLSQPNISSPSSLIRRASSAWGGGEGRQRGLPPSAEAVIVAVSSQQPRGGTASSGR